MRSIQLFLAAIASTNCLGSASLATDPATPRIDHQQNLDARGLPVIKGWLAALGLWLVGTLVFVVLSDTARVKEPGTCSGSDVELWPLLAVGSDFASLFVGVPLALLAAQLLRSVSSRRIQDLSLFAVITLLPAILCTVFSPESGLSALVFSALPGCCAAFGRAAACGSGWGRSKRDANATESS